MNSKLFDVLVDRNIITENTEIEAMVKRHDLSGVAHLKFRNLSFFVAHYLENDNDGVIIGCDVTDGADTKIDMCDVITIDGMEPARLASIYGLKENGDPLRMGARRGRKPKNREVAAEGV